MYDFTPDQTLCLVYEDFYLAIAFTFYEFIINCSTVRKRIHMNEKSYIIVVQCHIVKERCSGYFCEKSFFERSGGFACYSPQESIRILNMTCGGCCGLAVHRKLSDFLNFIKKKENITKEKIVVHLSSCIVKDNFHGPKCPHLDYLKDLISGKHGLDIVEGTRISKLAEARREQGIYFKE
jgi:predicted metal-binding protein